MSNWPIRAFARSCVLLSFLLFVPLAKAQSAPLIFKSAAVEGATTISDGVCSNPAVGISYELPEGMKPEDSGTIRQLAYAGSKRRGIGPEARYFLWGYQEEKEIVMLCGAGSQSGSVQMIASPASLITSQGPNALQQLVEGLGQELHARGAPPWQRNTNGLQLECADAQAEVNSSRRGKIEIRATSCAGVVNSYVVMWNLIGYSKAEWKNLVAGMNSVKVSAPQPLRATVSPSSPRIAHGTIAPDFQARLNAFMKAWLATRNAAKTMAFFDKAAYSAPPLIGNYCSGWYRMGTPPQEAARFMSENLMGVPKDYPGGTLGPAIFSAWKRFPLQWLSASANDVAKDHFLIASLNSTSLGQIFSGVFAGSDYGKYLRNQVRNGETAYWVVFPQVMPDGDIFVIFTLWQKTGEKWKITDMDTICQ